MRRTLIFDRLSENRARKKILKMRTSTITIVTQSCEHKSWKNIRSLRLHALGYSVSAVVYLL